MAMTNIMIIEQYKIDNNITCPLHTYAKWKSLGYQVKKGEKCKHRITIWKGCPKKVKLDDGSEAEGTKVIMKTSCFFTMEQVEAIQN